MKVLVATDVISRGIDLPKLDLVIHYNPPPRQFSSYIHRCRTIRSGKSIVLLIKGKRSNDFVSYLKDMVDLEEINAPSRTEAIEAAIDSCVERILDVDPELSNITLRSAEKLYQDRGIEALSAALVLITQLKTIYNFIFSTKYTLLLSVISSLLFMSCS